MSYSATLHLIPLRQGLRLTGNNSDLRGDPIHQSKQAKGGKISGMSLRESHFCKLTVLLHYRGKDQID